MRYLACVSDDRSAPPLATMPTSGPSRSSADRSEGASPSSRPYRAIASRTTAEFDLPVARASRRIRARELTLRALGSLFNRRGYTREARAAQERARAVLIQEAP